MSVATTPAAPTGDSEHPAVELPALGGYWFKRHCEESITKDMCPSTWDPSLKAPDSPAVVTRKNEGIEFEAKIEAALREAVAAGTIAADAVAFIPSVDRTDAQVKAATTAAAQQATMAAIKAGVPLLWNPFLPDDIDGGRVGLPDVMVKVPGGYAFVDVKHHRSTSGETAKAYPVSVLTQLAAGWAFTADTDLVPTAGNPRKDDALQLAHYYRQGQALGVVPTGGADGDGDGDSEGRVWAGVIGKDEQVLWFDLAERLYMHEDSDGVRSKQSALEIYDANYVRTRYLVAKALEHEADPAVDTVTFPVWTSECGECPWRTVCHDELAEADHISLLPGVTGRIVAAHARQGLDTVADLARLHVPTAVAVDVFRADKTKKRVDVPSLIAAAKAVVAVEPASAALPAARLFASSKLADTAAAALQTVGVRTVADVAAFDVATAAYDGAGALSLARSIDQARVVKVQRVHRARGVDWVEIPRASIELDIDIEDDGDGLCYLIGVLATGRRKRGSDEKIRREYHAFVSWDGTPAGEAKAFAEFWAYLVAMRAYARARRYGWRTYHYTDHETRFFRTLAERHAGTAGVPTLAELDEFLTSEAWVDMYPIVAEQLVWPTENLTLKSVAKYVKFYWRDEDPSGGNSVAWYRQAITDPDEAVRTDLRARILEYNEDDVKATAAVRQWVSEFGETCRPGMRLPSVADLDERFARTARPVRRRKAPAA